MHSIEIGTQIPDFQGKDQYGKEIKLSDYHGKKLIIFFYPKANTPGCTAEVCSLRDGYNLLKKKGFELLGISADSQEKQFKFSEKYQFPFPLLADTDHKIAEIFGVWGEKKMMGRVYQGIHRRTFVLDENQKVTHIVEKVKTKNHAEQLLQILS